MRNLYGHLLLNYDAHGMSEAAYGRSKALLGAVIVSKLLLRQPYLLDVRLLDQVSQLTKIKAGGWEE